MADGGIQQKLQRQVQGTSNQGGQWWRCGTFAQLKRQKVSVSGFFGDSEESDTEAPGVAQDELATHLALAQVSNKVQPTIALHGGWRKRTSSPDLEV